MPLNNNIIALWTHPRSISTAFERYFIERNDHAIYHEPFSYDYFINNKKEEIIYNEDKEHPRKYSDIKKMIIDKSMTSSVFHKDMCYHCDSNLLNDDKFLSLQINTFLIRDPWKTIVSHNKVRPSFSLNSVGYEAIYNVYNKVKKLGLKTLIIDADDLLKNPEFVIEQYCKFTGLIFKKEHLNWKPEMVDIWKTWPGWHESVSKSTGLKAKKDTAALEKIIIPDDPKLKAYAEHHMKYYQELYKDKLMLD